MWIHGIRDTNYLRLVRCRHHRGSRLRDDGYRDSGVCLRFLQGIRNQRTQWEARWRTQNRNFTPNDMARMKTIERENARLKKLLAEKELDNDLLREAVRGKS